MQWEGEAVRGWQAARVHSACVSTTDLPRTCPVGLQEWPLHSDIRCVWPPYILCKVVVIVILFGPPLTNPRSRFPPLHVSAAVCSIPHRNMVEVLWVFTEVCTGYGRAQSINERECSRPHSALRTLTPPLQRCTAEAAEA